MQRRKFMTLLGGALAPSSAAVAESAAKVIVLDADFRQIKIIASDPDLAAFNEHWATRRRSAYLAMQAEYKIDIQYGKRSERWLYDPAGVARVLSKKKTPLYRLESPSAFNELLGITRQRVR